MTGSDAFGRVCHGDRRGVLVAHDAHRFSPVADKGTLTLRHDLQKFKEEPCRRALIYSKLLTPLPSPRRGETSAPEGHFAVAAFGHGGFDHLWGTAVEPNAVGEVDLPCITMIFGGAFLAKFANMFLQISGVSQKF